MTLQPGGEQVLTRIRNAEANGKVLGRPQRIFRRNEALRLRAEGISRRATARERVARLLLASSRKHAQ